MSSEAPPPLNETQPPVPAPASGMSQDTWCMLAHLLGLCGYLGNGIGSIIGPLVVWLIKKDTHPKIGEAAREALNFNISVAIYGLLLSAFILLTFGFGAIIAVPLLVALWIFHLVCVIAAALKANEGISYRYPFTIRLVK